MRVAFWPGEWSTATTVGSTSTTLSVSLSLHRRQMRNGFEIFHCLPQTAFTSFSFRLIPSHRLDDDDDDDDDFFFFFFFFFFFLPSSPNSPSFLLSLLPFFTSLDW